MKQSQEHSTELLRSSGLRATTQRILLLASLIRFGTPVSADTLAKSTKGKADLATVYRALQEFERVGLVSRIVRKEGSLYELLGMHHHHLVCQSCDRIEDVEACIPKSLYAKLLQSSKHFSRVEDHELEFFGRCISCSK